MTQPRRRDKVEGLVSLTSGWETSVMSGRKGQKVSVHRKRTHAKHSIQRTDNNIQTAVCVWMALRRPHKPSSNREGFAEFKLREGDTLKGHKPVHTNFTSSERDEKETPKQLRICPSSYLLQKCFISTSHICLINLMSHLR